MLHFFHSERKIWFVQPLAILKPDIFRNQTWKVRSRTSQLLFVASHKMHISTQKITKNTISQVAMNSWAFQKWSHVNMCNIVNKTRFFFLYLSNGLKTCWKRWTELEPTCSSMIGGYPSSIMVTTWAHCYWSKESTWVLNSTTSIYINLKFLSDIQLGNSFFFARQFGLGPHCCFVTTWPCTTESLPDWRKRDPAVVKHNLQLFFTRCQLCLPRKTCQLP